MRSFKAVGAAPSRVGVRSRFAALVLAGSLGIGGAAAASAIAPSSAAALAGRHFSQIGNYNSPLYATKLTARYPQALQRRLR